MTTGFTDRVHVICAPPNGRNPGMTSVDLAFEGVARAAGLSDVSYWRLWDVSEWRTGRDEPAPRPRSAYSDPDSGLVYRSIRAHPEEVLDADLIVYWGDFLHMAVYQRQTEDVLVRRIGACQPDEAHDLVARTLMLRGVTRSALERTLTFGSTLGMNTPADYVSPYGGDLRVFLQGIRGAWMRDPYSAEVVRAIRGSEHGTAQALDAAFLLHDGRHRGGGGIGVFIGRSQVQPEVVATFGRLLAKRLQADAQWIAWGGQPTFWPVDGRRRFRAAWPALEHPGESSRARLLAASLAALRGDPKAEQPPVGARELIDRVGDFDVILTDTYHLAVNAWAQGVPAICFVDEGGPDWSVNSGEPHMRRDKRVDLYSQLDALGLVVDLSGLGRRLPQEVHRVADYLGDRALLTVSMDRIETLRAQSIEAVVRAVSLTRGPRVDGPRSAPATAVSV